ncbi:MAG: glycosyltransferase family 39 protein [Planctomycetes bacterium]|nr:glycosyltransferase family 39 protein [Planctomycetota bacterium]
MPAPPCVDPPAAAPAPSRRGSPWWLLGGLAGPLVLFAVDAGLGAAERLTLLARLLYWAPAVALGVAAGAGIGWWRQANAPGRALLRSWPGALAAVVLVAVVFTVAPPTLRVQFDETSLASVAQNMHAQRAALMTTGAVPFDGELVRLENTVDKRPPLFAFLVGLVHDVRGDRVGNAFVVNAALLGLGLVLVFAAVRARLGLVAGFAAQLLLVSVPLTGLVASSGGFELLATVLFAAVLLAALAFVRQPDGTRAFVLLALGGLFAQARYESLPAFALVVLLVLVAVRRRFVPGRGTIAVAVLQGWLLAPILGLAVYARRPDFYPEAAGAPLLAVRHLAAHAPAFGSHWFDPALANPLPGQVAIVAALAWLLRLARRRATFADALVVAPVAAVTLVALLWFYGDVREPTALRLFLPAAWLSALGPVVLLTPESGRAPRWLLLVAALVLAGLRLGELARGTTFPRLPNAELAAAIERTVAAVPGTDDDRRHTLWVAVTAQHLILRGHAALPPRSFLARLQEVGDYAQRGHIRIVYVLTTPLDAAFAGGFGDPQQVLGICRSDVVQRSDGEQPITVHRLQLRR